MIIFDIVIDIIFWVYTTLGFGTKEYKINTKMDKLGKEYPDILYCYLQNQSTFEIDDELGLSVLNLNLKSDVDKQKFVTLVRKRFSLDLL